MNDVFWVFGYGSLMWDPGFGPVETVKARLEGYSRSFCLRSTRYRGTEEAPGDVELFLGSYYKAYRGMGSMGAMGPMGAPHGAPWKN